MKNSIYLRPLAGLAIVAIIGFFVGLWSDILWLRLICKPLPVFVLMLVLFSCQPQRPGKAIIGGLLLSMIGDILLEVPANLFVPGLLAFLLAHLCYIVAFVSRSRVLGLVWLLPFGLWCGGMYAWMAPGLAAKKLVVPVAVYVLVICVMMWRAAAAWRAQDLASQIALIGAIFFAFSDSCIAVNKFISPFAGARELIIATYWIGQFGIAYSVIRPHLQKANHQ